MSTVVPLYSHLLYNHTSLLVTLFVRTIFFKYKILLYSHNCFIITITPNFWPNIIINIWDLCNRKGGNSKKIKNLNNVKSVLILAFKTQLAYKSKFKFFLSFLPFYCKDPILS